MDQRRSTEPPAALVMALAILGFGVFPRTATDVWTKGGPWFVPMWKTPQARADANAGRKQHKHGKS